MGQKDSVFEQKLKHKGYFNYSEFYTFAYGWLKEKGLSVVEDEYVEKIGGDGKEIKVSWKASKGVTDYFKYHIKVGIDVKGLVDAEVEIDGKKTKTNKGDLTFKISAEIEKDYNGEWEKTTFNKFIRGIYDKYIIKSTGDAYSDKLAGLCQSLIEDIKANLNLEGKR